MDYRRLQHSYPPRPSPLGASQEPRDPQQFPTSFTESRQEADKPRPCPSPSSNTTPSPSQLYQPSALRTSNTSRDTSSAYFPRNGPTQVHRRHGSLETRNHEQTHRRNNSQPQTVRYREGLLGASVMNNTPSQHETARRTSHGSSGSPGFSGPNERSALPALGNRQMPPPSPPHSYSSRAQSTHAPGASLASRDVPSGQALRPGSSMSISAMLGSDPDRSAREPAREPARESAPFFSQPPASSTFGNAPPSSSSAAMSPPTAPARPSPLDNSFFRRSHTPEKPFSKPQGARTYRSGSGGGSSVGGEQSVFGGLTRSSLSQYPEKPHSTHPSPRISTAEPPYSEPRRMSLNGPITRPSSQPPHADAPTRPPGYSPISQPGGVADRPFESGPRAASGSYRSHDPQHGRIANVFGERRSEDTAQRERERAPAHGSDAKLTQHEPYRYGSHYGERDPLDRHKSGSTWDHGRSHPPSPESKRFPAPEHGFGFGAIQSYTKSLGSQPGGNRQPQTSLQSRSNQPTPPPHDPYLRHQGQPPRTGSTPAITASTAAASSGLAALADEGRRKGNDELLHHRSLLAVGVDGKRGGRASPLPQAVQGAQAPYIGPTGEPAIKNELGRVFSGIGSGVGGVTAATGGSGPSTPLGTSPFKRDSLTGRSLNEGMDDVSKLARPSSAAGRRSRKSREEEQMEIEANDARGILSARNARRARHSHHHHHHHHHHRHKVDEEAATLSSLQRPSFFHRTSPAEHPGTHHHHQHHHHHHHHAPRPATIPAASPIREPRTTVNLEPLLSSVAHLPRHHLGSTLYAPRIRTPTAKSSLDSSKFGYTTTPQPLPRFEQRENCTFTVRVPRFRINQSHREEICARRALWGTGVYTDDSDPVAAAIHSGFIRGAWGDDVDESMLDLEIKDTYQHAPPPEPTTDGKSPVKGPRLPPIPPTDKDLHITLLVLPRVAQYDSTLMFGLKSRKWDGRHDGMSFKVHAVDWVDEGVARGEERSGEARRKRLRTLMQTGRICTGPAMAKMDELRRDGVQVPRVIDGQDQPAAVQPVS